jgi:hypothetical protein
MKDLYRRIGLPAQTDDRAAIERALGSAAGGDAGSARAARHVLLDPDRKPVYDRTRAVVMRVGQLRANLGLSRSPNWLASDCSDFDTTAASAVPQLEALRARRQRAPVAKQGLGIGLWIGLGIGAVVLSWCIIAGLLANPYLSGQSSGPTASRGSPTYLPPRTSTTYQQPLPPVDTRADKVRKLVTRRLERAGLEPDAATVDDAVQRLIQGRADDLPSTGVLTRNFYGQGVAPLEIKTRFGSNYYVKVVEWTTKVEVLTAFIRGGQPFETMVPVGSYEIKYAAGQTWYGTVLDFGEGASYSRCDDRFDFTRTFNGYNGYTIELILQRHGNLQTDPISPDDF